MTVKMLLQPFIRIVYAKLFEAILLQNMQFVVRVYLREQGETTIYDRSHASKDSKP